MYEYDEYDDSPSDYMQGMADQSNRTLDTVNRMIDYILAGKPDPVYNGVEFNRLYERLKSLIVPPPI
jgi:hypothetical protein